MPVREEAFRFGSTHQLAGVLTPAPSRRQGPAPALLLLNAGVVHHIGPSRVYVRLARGLSELGFDVLRFDFSGLGDSEPRPDRTPPHESMLLETREAMDALRDRRRTRRFLLGGICSGATAAYGVARDDPRVEGAVLINARAHLHGREASGVEDLKRRTLAHHSWRIALRSSFRAKNVRKALQGRLDTRKLLGMMLGAPLRLLTRQAAHPQSSTADSGAATELTALAERGLRLFHLYCEGDEGLDYFHVMLGRQAREIRSLPGARLEVLRGANHMFTLRWSQDRLVDMVSEWVRPFAAGTVPPAETSSSRSRATGAAKERIPGSAQP